VSVHNKSKITLALKIAAAVLGALVSMWVLHGAIFLLTGDVAGPIGDLVIWGVSMWLGLGLPLELVRKYRKRHQSD
jgi:hypothetical protein